MVTAPGGRLCRCGVRGCWETEVGALAIAEAVGWRGVSVRELGRHVRMVVGGPHEAGLREVAVAVGRGVGTLVNLLNPRAVVLGGLLGDVHARWLTPSRMPCGAWPWRPVSSRSTWSPPSAVRTRSWSGRPRPCGRACWPIPWRPSARPCDPVPGPGRKRSAGMAAAGAAARCAALGAVGGRLDARPVPARVPRSRRGGPAPGPARLARRPPRRRAAPGHAASAARRPAPSWAACFRRRRSARRSRRSSRRRPGWWPHAGRSVCSATRCGACGTCLGSDHGRGRDRALSDYTLSARLRA